LSYKDSKEHNISETGSVLVLRCGVEDTYSVVPVFKKGNTTAVRNYKPIVTVQKFVQNLKKKRLNPS
jgi:hypothetical protein